MASKRDHHLAFACDGPPKVMRPARPSNRFEQLLQPNNPDSSPSSLFVPGRWPRTPESASHIAAPAPTLAADTASAGTRHYSAGFILYTVGRWTGTVGLPALLSLPLALVKFFGRRRKLRVQPITREDGARKKRIIDAGMVHASPTPTSASRALARASGLRNITKRRSTLNAVTYPDTTYPVAPPSPIWSSPPTQIAQDPTTVSDATANNDVDMDDTDDSVEWSWNDVLASNTPPQIPVFKAIAPSPCPEPKLPKGHEQFSPNTHRRIISKTSKTSATPMRKLLVKAHLNALGIATSPTASALHTTPPSSKPLPKISKMKQQTIEASLLKINASSVERKARKASEQHKAQAEARRNSEAEIAAAAEAVKQAARQAAEQAYYNYTETVDVDLSTLPDAPDCEEESLTPKRKVRFTEQATAKSFYCDEVVANMHNTVLEDVVFSPRKSVYRDTSADASGDTSEDEAQEVSSPSASNSPTTSPTKDEPESIGFTGVPASTWEDSEDSIDESQFSTELIKDLQDDLDKKLALAPPPPPPPVYIPLVHPLRSPEYNKVEAAAKKVGFGKLETFAVKPSRLTAHDFSTVWPQLFNGDKRAWLNDSVVNEYLAILITYLKQQHGFKKDPNGPAPRVHAFTSFWYDVLSKPHPEGLKGVERWPARFQLDGAKYLDAEILLYPICDGFHWRLIVVRPKERTIQYLDSMSEKSAWGSPYVKKLKTWMAHNLGDLYVEKEWTFLARQRSMRQANASDCGVFLLLNALVTLRGESFTRVHVCDGMQNARERIAFTLLNGAPTTEFL